MTTLKDYLEAHYSPRSIYHYLDKIGKFLEYDENAINLTQIEILNYIGYLRSLKLHPKTIRNHMYSIKIYYNYLQASGQRNDHPCKHLNLKDQINRAVHLEGLYSMEEMEAFLSSHQTRPELQRRDEIIISLLIYQALTNTEIVNLTVADIDLEGGKVRINTESSGAKNINLSRTLGLKPKQILLIDRYLNQDRETLLSRNLNPSITDKNSLLLTKYGKQIKPAAITRQINQGEPKRKKMTPLKIRQSVIHHKLKEGHNVRVVQAFAGHRSILSTEAYQVNKLEKLKQGINQFHPLQ